MPIPATSAHASTVASSIKTTPSLPSYSFVTPDQLTSSASKSKAPGSTVQGEYWSQTSSDEEEPARTRPYQSRKSQSVLTQSSTITTSFDWDSVEVVIDATILHQDQIWIPMYDLKPVPKHSSAHWADFCVAALYHKVSSELDLTLAPNAFQFVYLNQPGNFAFRREGAYRIVLKRFAQMINSPDQVLRLRLERVAVHRTPVLNSTSVEYGQRIFEQNSRGSPASAKKSDEPNRPKAKPMITSDIQSSNINHKQSYTNANRPYDQTLERPRKRIKLPTQNIGPSPSISEGATDTDTTPPSGNAFTAVNSPPAAADVPVISPHREEHLSIPAQPSPPPQTQYGQARAVMFSETEASDQEMTQPDDHEITQDETIALIKMEGAG